MDTATFGKPVPNVCVPLETMRRRSSSQNKSITHDVVIWRATEDDRLGLCLNVPNEGAACHLRAAARLARVSKPGCPFRNRVRMLRLAGEGTVTVAAVRPDSLADDATPGERAPFPGGAPAPLHSIQGTASAHRCPHAHAAISIGDVVVHINGDCRFPTAHGCLAARGGRPGWAPGSV